MVSIRWEMSRSHEAAWLLYEMSIEGLQSVAGQRRVIFCRRSKSRTILIAGTTLGLVGVRLSGWLLRGLLVVVSGVWVTFLVGVFTLRRFLKCAFHHSCRAEESAKEKSLDAPFLVHQMSMYEH
jgi:hypothetical protein